MDTVKPRQIKKIYKIVNDHAVWQNKTVPKQKKEDKKK